jgi:uncharacterized membrane protein YcfT
MEKALVASTIDGVVIFVGFLLSKKLEPDWALAIRALIGSFQPLVIYLICKWAGIALLIKAGLMK